MNLYFRWLKRHCLQLREVEELFICSFTYVIKLFPSGTCAFYALWLSKLNSLYYLSFRWEPWNTVERVLSRIEMLGLRRKIAHLGTRKKMLFFCWGYPDMLSIFQYHCALADQQCVTCTDVGQAQNCLKKLYALVTFQNNILHNGSLLV